LGEYQIPVLNGHSPFFCSVLDAHVKQLGSVAHPSQGAPAKDADNPRSHSLKKQVLRKKSADNQPDT